MKSHQISEKIEFYAVINEFLVTGSLVMVIDGSLVPVRSVSISHIASGQSTAVKMDSECTTTQSL